MSAPGGSTKSAAGSTTEPRSPTIAMASPCTRSGTAGTCPHGNLAGPGDARLGQAATAGAGQADRTFYIDRGASRGEDRARNPQSTRDLSVITIRELRYQPRPLSARRMLASTSDYGCLDPPI